MHMSFVRMFTDEQGKSRFEDLSVGSGESPIGSVSSYLPVSRMRFRRRDADLPIGRLNVPERQFAVVLTGGVEVEVGDGERRSFSPGSVIFAEDTIGEGHIARVDSFVEQVYITVPDDFDVHAWVVDSDKPGRPEMN